VTAPPTTRARRGRRAATAALLVALASGWPATAARAADDATAVAPVAPVADAAGGEPRPLVLVFTPAAAGPLAARLEAELAAVGMTARRVVVADDATSAELAPRVAEAGARGAIRVSVGPLGAEVWIPDPETGRAALRQALSSESSQGMESVIVPRTVEFLRASLLPAAPSATAAATVEAKPAPSPAATLASLPAPPRPPPRLRLAAGSAVMGSPGGVGAVPQVAIALGVRVLGPAGVEAIALLPLSTPELETTGGSIRVSLALAGGGVYAKLIERARWSLEAAAGALAVSVRTEGDARGLYVGQKTSALTVSPYLRAGAAVNLTSWLGARLDLLGGAARDRMVISVQEGNTLRRVATWGRPLGAAVLSLQASWL